jgi:hypothetical protein
MEVPEQSKCRCMKVQEQNGGRCIKVQEHRYICMECRSRVGADVWRCRSRTCADAWRCRSPIGFYAWGCRINTNALKINWSMRNAEIR